MAVDVNYLSTQDISGMPEMPAYRVKFDVEASQDTLVEWLELYHVVGANEIFVDWMYESGSTAGGGTLFEYDDWDPPSQQFKYKAVAVATIYQQTNDSDESPLIDPTPPPPPPP